MYRFLSAIVLILLTHITYALPTRHNCPELTVQKLMSPYVFDEFFKGQPMLKADIMYHVPGDGSVEKEIFIAKFKEYDGVFGINSVIEPRLGIADFIGGSYAFCQYAIPGTELWITIK